MAISIHPLSGAEIHAAIEDPAALRLTRKAGFQTPFMARGPDAARLFHFGGSVLLPARRRYFGAITISIWRPSMRG